MAEIKKKHTGTGFTALVQGHYETILPTVLANVVTVLVCILVYDVYLLLDQYFHTVVIAVLMGIAVKPLKQFTIGTILSVIYGAPPNEKPGKSVVQVIADKLIFDEEEALAKKELQKSGENSNEQASKEIQPGEIIEPSKTKEVIEKPVKKRSPLSTKISNRTVASIIVGIVNEDEENKENRLAMHYLKQLINIISLAFLFYFLKRNIGLIFYGLLLFLNLVWRIIYKKMAHRIDPFVVKLRAIISLIVKKETVSSFLSKTFSFFCTVLVVVFIIGSLIFSVYMVQQDFMRIQQVVVDNKYSKSVVNYVRNLNVSNFINSSILSSALNIDVGHQIDAIFKERQTRISNDSANCIKAIKSYSRGLVPEFITTRICIVYSQISLNSLKSYFGYIESFAGLMNKTVWFLVSPVMGAFNFLFLYSFKAFIFLTTIYYIIEDLKYDWMMNLMGRVTGRHKDSWKMATSFFREIKYIVSSSLLIAMSHFILSWVLMDILDITAFNFVISVFLGCMALVPLYRPWLGALLVSFLSYYAQYNTSKVAIIAFNVLYYMISNQIFFRAYSRISIPHTFTNLSVVLGIYQYGILGIIYGPLVVALVKRIFQAYKEH